MSIYIFYHSQFLLAAKAIFHTDSKYSSSSSSSSNSSSSSSSS